MNGKLVHGLVHPEMGHIRVPHDLAADPYPGHCPYHGDCLEGLACGPAINDRWRQPSETMPADHPAWSLEASYLALLSVLAQKGVLTQDEKVTLRADVRLGDGDVGSE